MLMFHSVLKPAYHLVGSQYSETRYHNHFYKSNVIFSIKSLYLLMLLFFSSSVLLFIVIFYCYCYLSFLHCFYAVPFLFFHELIILPTNCVLFTSLISLSTCTSLHV